MGWKNVEKRDRHGTFKTKCVRLAFFICFVVSFVFCLLGKSSFNSLSVWNNRTCRKLALKCCCYLPQSLFSHLSLLCNIRLIIVVMCGIRWETGTFKFSHSNLRCGYRSPVRLPQDPVQLKSLFGVKIKWSGFSQGC